MSFLVRHVTLLFGLINYSMKNDSILTGQIKENICSKWKSGMSCLSQSHSPGSYLDCWLIAVLPRMNSKSRLYSFFVCQCNSFHHFEYGFKIFLFLWLCQNNSFGEFIAKFLLRVVLMQNSDIHCFKIMLTTS